MKNEKIWMGFDIKVEPGAVLKPKQIHFWKEQDFKEQKPEAPFHYMSDALVGLSLVHLNPHLKNPFSTPKMNFGFCHEAWRALEPHHELFNRSQSRIQALRAHMKGTPDSIVTYFERNFTEVLESSIYPWGIDLEHLLSLVDSIEFLENKMETPLLYNFNLKFSKSIVDKLHYLHSLLFNLRCLMAVDYNAHIQDPSHEALKVDSITDYLNKAEYVANDALLYLNFLRHKEKIHPSAIKNLENGFKQYSHNGYCLVKNLPKSFIGSLSTHELEETLYIVQMDWLLGTDAGLLFKIREELYALNEGYEHIFWPEAQGKAPSTQDLLSVNCELTLGDIYPDSKAA